MRTFIIENTWMSRDFTDRGWGNGYVIVPEGHPWHGVHYDAIDADVHGGLTFSQPVDELIAEDWNAGLFTEKDAGSWVVGFDTAHSRDTMDRWPESEVQAEANRLLEQAQNAISKEPINLD